MNLRTTMNVLALLATVVSGCASWSKVTYESLGDESPPAVTHESFSVGIGRSASPIEAAHADAIGTDAKTRMRRGAGGYAGYGGTVYSPGSVGMYDYYPPGAPVNRVLKLSNHTGVYIRVAMHGRATGGLIAPDQVVFVTSPAPRGFAVKVCGYEAPGGAYLGGGSFFTKKPGICPVLYLSFVYSAPSIDSMTKLVIE